MMYETRSPKWKNVKYLEEPKVTIQTPEAKAERFLFTYCPQLINTPAHTELIRLIKNNVEVKE